AWLHLPPRRAVAAVVAVAIAELAAALVPGAGLLPPAGPVTRRVRGLRTRGLRANAHIPAGLQPGQVGPHGLAHHRCPLMKPPRMPRPCPAPESCGVGVPVTGCRAGDCCDWPVESDGPDS